MAIIQLTPTGASGNGANQLSPTNFSVNTSRTESRSTTFTAGDYGLNKLTITQQHSPSLFINASTDTSQSITSPSSSATWLVSGSTNGRYMKYSISNGVTVSSAKEYSNNTSQGSSIGTSYSSVSSFVGGSQEFEYHVTISIPSGLSAGTYTLTIYSSDTQNGSGAVSQTFTLTVTAQAVDVQAVIVNPSTLEIGIGNSYKYNNQTVTVNSSSRNQLHCTYDPVNATVISRRWASGDTDIATVSSSGLVKGVAEGSTYIRCWATSDGVNEVSGNDGRCYPLTVFANGTISVTNMTIETLAQSGTSTMSLSNIDTSKTLSVAFSDSMPSWIHNISVNTTTSPYRVIVECYPNSTHAQDHTTTAYVTGTDNLGNTIESQAFTIYQKWETPCTAMTINGSDTIHNSNNYGDYTVSYTPAGTTENRCVWSVSDTSIATVQEGQSNDECRVTAVSSGTVTLYATNYYDNSIIAQKQIDVTFVHPRGDITLSPTSVTLPYNATTDSTVAITTTGISGNLTITPDSGGFITGGEIVNNHLKIYFTANDGTTTERSCSVTVSGRDDNDDLISNTVQYLQEGLPVSTNNIGIGDITPVYDAHQETLKDVVLRVNFINNGTISTVFTSVAYTMTGYTDAQGTTVNFTKSGSLANRVDVTAGTTPVDYTIESVGALGIPARVDVTVTATNNSANLTASDTLHIN